jgi:Tfp pilus assembly protein PilZ
VDVLTALEAGMINRADQDHNVADYCLLHQSWMSQRRFHGGIIVSPQQRYPIGEELRRLMRLIAGIPAEEMCNRIEFLSGWM